LYNAPPFRGEIEGGYFTMIFFPSTIFTPFGSTEGTEKIEFTEMR
jgi:hypothetical protein